MLRRRLLPILLLCSSLLATAASADNPINAYCPSDANYTRGSAFQASLDALLSSLPATAAAASTGFATNTTGTTPDQAYGLAQCRADVANSPDCSACLDGSAQDMAASKCAGQKKAMLIYDNCLLRVSDESFVGAVDNSEALSLVNTQNATQPELFTPQLGALMNNLTRKAAYESPRMFAAGPASVTPFVSIFGMAQCTRDLAADDCYGCLIGALGRIPTCCDGKQGGQVIYVSCSIRFEVSAFYNIQAAEAAMSPAPAPGGGGFVNGSDHSGPGSNGESWTLGPRPVSSPVPFLRAAPVCIENEPRETQNVFYTLERSNRVVRISNRTSNTVRHLGIKNSSRDGGRGALAELHLAGAMEGVATTATASSRISASRCCSALPSRGCQRRFSSPPALPPAATRAAPAPPPAAASAALGIDLGGSAVDVPDLLFSWFDFVDPSPD